MAKLELQAAAGFNAGMNYNVKLTRLQDIVIDPEISQVFAIQEKTLELVTQNMQKNGYDV